MNPRLIDISATVYAREVLPLSAQLWAHGRNLQTYAADTTALAQTPYGRASYRTVALSDGAEILASFKRYERAARVSGATLRSIGIGAVFTPEQLRGRGYASAMLAMALDEARSAGVDFAFLFSDIRPAFYQDLGFVELPSRSISVRADTLAASRIDAQPIGTRDWSGVRLCFEAMESRRECALLRPPAVWNWLRLRMSQGARHASGQIVHLLVRRGRSVAAYVIGRREPRHDAYVADEFAFADERGREVIPALLRCAAGDLRRIVGWLPPSPARGVLPRGSVRKRADAILMATALSHDGARFVRLAQASGGADPMWSLDHI